MMGDSRRAGNACLAQFDDDPPGGSDHMTGWGLGPVTTPRYSDDMRWVYALGASIIGLACSKAPVSAASPGGNEPPTTRIPDEVTPASPSPSTCPEGTTPFELDHHDGAIACIEDEEAAPAENGPDRGDDFDEGSRL